MRRALLIGLILPLVTGCGRVWRAHYPPTPALRAHAPDSGYRFRNLPPGAGNTDSLFVVLTFSGGGTRAAALSYGVLRELSRTSIAGSGGAPKSLLDEVDVISSVSGGSFTAAYFALNGLDSLDRFERDFLRWNAETELKKRVASGLLRQRLQSPHFSRIDVAAEIWDRRLFHGRTFGDLLKRARRPFIIINASDISAGDPFSFTQEIFDPLCGDLVSFPLSRAVAASSAFPGLLSPITIENNAPLCRYLVPVALQNALESPSADPDRYRLARHVLSYRNGAVRPFIHLIDGGLADNIGLRPVLRSLRSTDPEFSILRMIGNGQVKRLVVIVVNAKVERRSTIDAEEQPPGTMTVLQAAVGKPMGNFSQESVALLLDAKRESERAGLDAEALHDTIARVAPAAATTPPHFPRAEWHVIEVSFDDLPDPTEREYYLNLPTTFALPSRTIDLLIDIGGRLLRESPAYTDLVAALGGSR